MIVKIICGGFSAMLVNPTPEEELSAIDMAERNKGRHAVEIFRYRGLK